MSIGQVGQTIAIQAVVDRHKKVLSAVVVVSGAEADLKLEAFAELYESLPQLTIDTPDMHGFFLGERALDHRRGRATRRAVGPQTARRPTDSHGAARLEGVTFCHRLDLQHA